MAYPRAWRKRPRRASKGICDKCGYRVFLGPCGVDDHLFAKPGQRRQPGDCNGRVYIHEETGGMGCLDGMGGDAQGVI